MLQQNMKVKSLNIKVIKLKTIRKTLRKFPHPTPLAVHSFSPSMKELEVIIVFVSNLHILCVFIAFLGI